MENFNKCYFEFPPRNTESVSNDPAYKYIPESVTENVKIFYTLCPAQFLMCNGGQLFNKSVAALALRSHARFIRIGSTVQAHHISPNIEKSVPKSKDDLQNSE